MSRLRLPLVPFILAFAALGAAAPKGRLVPAHHRRLWVDLEGRGEPTVVFEAGGGNDSSVWEQIAPRIRAAGFRTFAYDRAGLGRSPVYAGPYRIEDEALALRAALTASGVRGPVLIVAHSYGGAIALLAAEKDPRVGGLVLLDALVPGTMPPGEVEAILAKYRPQYAELREKAPELAKAMIPLMEACPASARSLDAVQIPAGLPITDIVAEHTAIQSPQTEAIWSRAHAAFAAADPSRKAILATGSSHKVAQDKPDLVVDSILQMAASIKAKAR